MAAQPGNYTLSGVTYHFEENGSLASGIWKQTEAGMKYCYGPGWYGRGWHDIDGNTYYFGVDGCRYEGLRWVRESNSMISTWYDFGEDGIMTRKLDTTGFMTVDGNKYYLVDGVSQLGLVQVDGDYYYFHTTTCMAAVSCATGIWQTNGLMEAGTYYFDEEGRMTEQPEGFVKENGWTYYYENGVKTYAGLIEVEGHYYYVASNCRVVTGYCSVSKTNGLMPAGMYFFDETGKMVIPKEGIVEEDGVLYYYVDNVPSEAGLIQIEGSYYYAGQDGKLALGFCEVTKTNGLLEPGSYYFDEVTGAMAMPKNGIVEEEDGLYYYVNGTRTAAGLIEIDGKYYYVKSSGQLATGQYYVTRPNGLVEAGIYHFDETTGEMLTPKNGIIAEEGSLYYYVNGVRTAAGLIEIDGKYYYVKSSGQLATGRYYVTRPNGLMAAGWYDFDIGNGAMVQN